MRPINDNDYTKARLAALEVIAELAEVQARLGYLRDIAAFQISALDDIMRKLAEAGKEI